MVIILLAKKPINPSLLTKVILGRALKHNIYNTFPKRRPYEIFRASKVK
jgi:hypothetical protein